MEITPKYTDSRLTAHVRRAATDMGVDLPSGLALVFWNAKGQCRAFSLNEDNLHFAVPMLGGLYKHRSEIIPV